MSIQPIQLTDFPGLVTGYIDNNVTVTVSDVTPKNQLDTELNVSDRGKCTVAAVNAAADDGGLRLLNVRLHLEIVASKGKDADPNPKTDPKADTDAKTVAQLIAPIDPGVVCDDNNPDTVHDVAGGDPSTTGELIIKFTDDRSTLNAGGSLPPETVEIDCKEPGNVTVTAHIHADVDEKALFPNSRGKNGSGSLVVNR